MLKATRTSTVGVCALACGLMVGCTTVPRGSASRHEADSAHRHVLIRHESATDGWGGTVVRGAVSEAPLWLYMEPQSGLAGGGEAVYTSAELSPGLLFNEALLSWNVDAPTGTTVRFDLRARAAPDGEWSPWLYVGRAGGGAPPGERAQSFDRGRIDVDYFRSNQEFDRIQYRVSASRTAGASAAPVRVRRIAVCCTDLAPRDSAPPNAGRRPAPIALDVPFRSQRDESPAIAPHICSPTSVAMVMAFYGVEHPTTEVARAVRDEDFGIYGNWPRNVQVAYELGCEGYLARFSSWAEVRRNLEEGRPIIISFAAKKGEITGAPYESTDGHLLVVRGFDTRGNVLVCDPAASTPEAGTKAYRRSELTNLWLVRNAGTSYVLLRPGSRAAPRAARDAVR